jgi:predicted O-methyltransferase YrrM
MGIQHKDGTFYSVRELSQRLKVDVDEVTQLIKAKGFQTQAIDGICQISGEDLAPFLSEFQAAHGIPDRYYELPKWLEECATPWALTLADMYRQPFVFITALSPAQGDLLRTFVCNIAPRNVVEIGCFIGISTVWMAAGLEQSHSPGVVHSIDLFDVMLPSPPTHYAYIPDRLQRAQEFAKAAHLDHRIRFHQGDSKEVGKQIHQLLDGPIDFLFIDGDHTKAGCLADFIQFYPHVAIDGYIAFHDINPEHCSCTGPRYVIDTYVKTSPGLDLVEIQTTPSNYGIALIQKRGIDQKLLDLKLDCER